MDLSGLTILPYPGGPGFEQLPTDEQRWLEQVQSWYRKGKGAATPRKVMEHPTMDLFRSDLPHHLPFLVKYFCTAPQLFSMALRTLTGKDVEAPTLEGTQRAWALLILARAA